ncbi:DUF2461 domain-containing protein [Roseivirga echinicomitans]
MARKMIFEFLEQLSRNNSKEWMDANRAWYEEAKNEVVHLFEPILASLKDVDPRIMQPSARKAISRINNNLMFHPERPTYKNHFGVVFGHGKGLADFYVHMGTDETLMAGGIWHPDSAKLKKIRTEIDYEGHKFMEVIHSEPFKSWFHFYTEGALKTAPKGYLKDHEFIELLRLKSIAAMRPITRKDILSDGFHDMVVESYEAILPMIDFLNVAISDVGGN